MNFFFKSIDDDKLPLYKLTVYDIGQAEDLDTLDDVSKLLFMYLYSKEVLFTPESSNLTWRYVVNAWSLLYSF